MLPRVATTTGTLQPSLALQAGAPVDAAAKPQLSAAALANLRAEVLLRLIETMLKHMPRTGEPNPGRDLLETLFAALKAVPGREGDNARRLADIIAKLPPELRPSVEKLIGTVLSAMPTRSLVEIVRNPNGPEAQKLATLLATSLQLGDLPATERQQKPVGLTAQQLAAVGRHGGAQHTAQAAQVLGDARLLQVALKRTFDIDGGSKSKPSNSQQPAEARTHHQAFAGPSRLPIGTNDAARADGRLPNPAAKATDQQPMRVADAATRHNGDAEEAQAAAPAARREDMPVKAQVANAAGQALARSVLQAVTRDVAPGLLVQAVAQLMENLSPEEANFLRALLERPLDAAMEKEFAPIVQEQSEDGTERIADPETAAQTGKARPETAQPASVLQRPAETQDDALAMPQAREAAQPAALADAVPDRLLPAATLREGAPLAFVPYLPAEEDADWPEAREEEKDEAEDEPSAGGENEEGGDAQAQADGEAGDGEPESADMARRREKTAEMVGVMEPGLVFYQKLGDYWT
ncbi:hypothetical protein [Shinella sp. BYT-45]|uniref:hypothetical protein n=1 Tax=Shinella sp. BYT-45 TaxID=3377377 RepID=UPI003980922D